ncbi:MAG: GTP-binding protein [Alphaproteobacteria bacterium]|nr:GTP-binding protein [Alphaproteobacteria bacterium]
MLAHVDAGKTTLTERLLFVAGASEFVGDVDEGTAVSDWMPQEQRRGISITSAAVRLEWGRFAINLVDTPGHIDFVAEVEGSLRALDSVVLVVSSVEGVQPQTELIWRQLGRSGVPAVAFINKLDREGKDPEALIEEIEARLGARAVQLQLPWRDEAGALLGVVDLVHEVAWRTPPGRPAERRPWSDLPEDLVALAELHREALAEVLTEVDDELLELALEEQHLPGDRLDLALAKGLAARAFLPVLWGAAKPNVGVDLLLDAIGRIAPSPFVGRENASPEGAFFGIVFKVQRLPRHGRAVFLRALTGQLADGEPVRCVRTGQALTGWRAYHLHGPELEPASGIRPGDVVALLELPEVITGDALTGAEAAPAHDGLQVPEPVLMAAVEVEVAEHAPALLEGVQRLCEEDPSLIHTRDPETGQLLIGGLGELHLTVAVERLRADLGVPVRQGSPRVSRRLSVRGPGEGSAELQRVAEALGVSVRLHVQPLEAGEGIRLRLPEGLAPEVRRALRQGVEALERAQSSLEHPIHALAIEVEAVHLSDEAEGLVPLSACMAAAIRRAMEDGGLLLMEPWMRVIVDVPLDLTGPVLGDLQSRGAEIATILTEGARQSVRAQVPLARMTGYASDLRSMTQGRGEVLMRPGGFRPDGASGRGRS